MTQVFTATEAIEKLSQIKEFLSTLELRFLSNSNLLLKTESSKLLLENTSINFVTDLEQRLNTIDLDPITSQKMSDDLSKINQSLEEINDTNFKSFLDGLTSFFITYENDPNQILKSENIINLRETILLFNAERFF